LQPPIHSPDVVSQLFFAGERNEHAAFVDVHEEKELFQSGMSRIIGGRDVDNEKALVEAYGVINAINGPLNTPDPPPTTCR
jgi:hypothetical protein